MCHPGEGRSKVRSSMIALAQWWQLTGYDFSILVDLFPLVLVAALGERRWAVVLSPDCPDALYDVAIGTIPESAVLYEQGDMSGSDYDYMIFEDQ